MQHTCKGTTQFYINLCCVQQKNCNLFGS